MTTLHFQITQQTKHKFTTSTRRFKKIRSVALEFKRKRDRSDISTIASPNSKHFAERDTRLTNQGARCTSHCRALLSNPNCSECLTLIGMYRNQGAGHISHLTAVKTSPNYRQYLMAIDQSAQNLRPGRTRPPAVF